MMIFYTEDGIELIPIVSHPSMDHRALILVCALVQ